MSQLLKSKFIGSLVGTGVGDSLGTITEGYFGSREVREIGKRYTDDTAMAIGVAESLVENEGFNEEHMAETFMKNYDREPLRGYGPGPPKIFRAMKKGENWQEVASNLYHGGSYGNGSAMRIAPIGLFYYDEKTKLRDVAYKSSRINHVHPLGKEGAALQAYAVALAVKAKEFPLDKNSFLEKLKEFTDEETYRRKLNAIDNLLNQKEDKNEVIRELGNRIEAFNSVPTAIYSFLVNSSFEECLVYAVSLGGDTDTIGAMTGAIAGAYYAIEGIPPRWKDNLENKDYIQQLAESLWQIKSKE